MVCSQETRAFITGEVRKALFHQPFLLYPHIFALSPYKKNTAHYTVSRNSSMKRFNLLIAESSRNQKSLQQSEEKLRLFNHQLSCITQSTSSVIGNEYFNNLVQSLASVFGMRYAFIVKLKRVPQKPLEQLLSGIKIKL